MRCFHLPLVALTVFMTLGCDSANNESQVPAIDQEDAQNPMSHDKDEDDWQKTWDARLAALEHELGKSDDKIATSPVPIYLGGGADVLTFKKHVDGLAYVTAGLIGDDSQQKTPLGQYELMMCFRSGNDWAPSLLSRLAPYTFDAALNPGETMDIGPAMPENSTIVALLFVSYRQFKVSDTDAGILLCIGITDSELAHCRTNGQDAVLAALKENGVYPFTDTQRESAIQ